MNNTKQSTEIDSNRNVDNGQTHLIDSNESTPSPPILKKDAKAEIKPATNSKRKFSMAPQPAFKPPDGGWGWMVVFSAFIACAGVVGLTRAFGIIYVEIEESFPESSQFAISWIPGLYNTLSTGMAPVAGALSNKYSCKKVVFCGGLMMSTGLILNFFANSVEYLYVSFGIITGCGAGMCTTPGIMMVARYFKKRRALANGLCLAGTSLGAFVQPLVVEVLTKNYGFRGAMLIMGAVMLHISAFALVYRPLSPPTLKSKKTSSRTTSCVKKYCSFITCFFNKKYKTSTVPNAESKSMLKEPSPTTIEMSTPKDTPRTSPEKDSDTFDEDEDFTGKFKRSKSVCLDYSCNDLTTIQYQDQETQKKPEDTVVQKSPGPTGLRRYLDYGLFKNRAYVIFVISSALTSVGYPHASVFMPTYATQTLGVPKENTASLLSITAVADLIGRVGVGYLADLNLFKKAHGYMVAVATTATATLVLPVMKDYIDLGINSAFYGLGVGSFFMLTPVILTDHHGPEKVASSYGLLRLFHGVMSLIAPPIAGAFSDITGSYIPGFIFMGIAMMFGSIICFFLPKALAYEERKEANRKISSASLSYTPMGEINGPSEKERRSSHSSLTSWGRRFSVDPEPEM